MKQYSLSETNLKCMTITMYNPTRIVNAHFPKIHPYFFIFLITNLAFLLKLTEVYVFTYKLMITPKTNNVSTHVVVGNKQYKILVTMIVDTSKGFFK